MTAEFSVERTGSSQTRRCDIVAFVNGIPVLVIENKRPTETLKKADSQLIGYQSEDNIPQLFHFAQLLMTMNRVEAHAMPRSERHENSGPPGAMKRTRTSDLRLSEPPLTSAELDAVFSGDFAPARAYFASMAAESDRSAEQDRSIFALCRPERLLEHSSGKLHRF